MQTLLTVFTNAKQGRETDYNDWYSNVHIRDVMRLPGSIAVQRFVLSRQQPAPTVPHYKYLALYEIADRIACTKGHMDDGFTARMPISDSVDFDDNQEGYFDLVDAASKTAFGDGASGGFITARMNAKQNEDKALEAWFAAQSARLTHMPGISAAQLFRHSEKQFLPIPRPHSHEYLAVLRMAESGKAMESWQACFADWQRQQVPVDWASTVVAAYDPLFPRLRSEDVVNPPQEAAAEEKRARAALGDRVVAGFPLSPAVTTS